MLNNMRGSALGYFPHPQSIDTYPRPRVAMFGHHESYVCKFQGVDRGLEDRFVKMFL